MDERIYKLFDIGRKVIAEHGVEFVSLQADGYVAYTYEANGMYFAYAYVRESKAITESYRWDGERWVEWIS